MRKTLGLTLAVLILVACSEQKNEEGLFKASTNVGLTCPISDEVSAKAIYGDDNRLDWFESPGQTKDYWAKATLALMPAYNLKSFGDDFKISAPNYADVAGLCAGQPFAEQPSAAFCSGFLVSEDLVVTAGHCIHDINDCHRTMFVFDFAKNSHTQEEYVIPQSSVYNCKEIVAREKGASDYAVIRLNRKVEDRVPLNIRRSGRLQISEQVMLIGHPMGIPSKIADGGIVMASGDTIQASVDAFAANSGSVILNSQTGLVEGILVAGEADFKYQEGCRVEARCGSNCRGEVITPIAKVLSHIPNIVYSNPVCADSGEDESL